MANEKRLIDANALKEVLKEKHDWIVQDPEVSPSIKWGEAICNHRVCEAIEKSPTVDAVEVVHGRWIEVRDKKFGYLIGMKCSRCGRRVRNCGENYCPNCGADMRERKDKE